MQQLAVVLDIISRYIRRITNMKKVIAETILRVIIKKIFANPG